MKEIRMRFMKNSVIFEKMNTLLKRLFIIGNGFDRAHNLPTSYWDFRKYILTRYPDAESYYFIPESTLMPKGNEEYDETHNLSISQLIRMGVELQMKRQANQ